VASGEPAREELARAFLMELAGPSGRAVFARRGFRPVDGAGPGGGRE
jgi:hypothetical protein